MLQKQQVIPILLREFPDFRKRRNQCARRFEYQASAYPDMSLFVHFLTDELYERENYKQVDDAFQQMEQFLKEGSSEVRKLVALGFLETLRIIASWKPYGSDAFLQFLYPESRRVWTNLDAAWNINLDNCGVLEREVLIWRVVRQRLSYLNI